METKIEVAINDTKLRLKKVEQEIMLLLRDKNTLMQQISALETIECNKELI